MISSERIALAILLVFPTAALMAQQGMERSLIEASKPAKPQADPGDMITDRPDFTESASTIKPRWYQLETGMALSWETGESGKTRSLTLPFPLLRIGLTDRIELRYSTDGFARNRFITTDGQEVTRGMSDVQVGMKVRLLDEKKFLPQVAVIGQMSEPLGHRQFTSGTIDPSTKICWSKDLPAGWGISGNLNYISLQEDGKRFLERDTTVSVGHDLVAGFSGYVEYYRLANVALDGTALSIAQVGWARQLRGNFQFDMSVAKSFAGSIPQWSIMAGFSYRAPVPGFGFRH